MRAEYERFSKALGELTGVTVDAARLKKEIEIVNNLNNGKPPDMPGVI